MIALASLPLLAFTTVQDPGDLARLDMQPVELQVGGETIYVERGDLTVPCVRADPKSKPITIDVWRFPRAESADPETPPIFELHGGPGWPGMEPGQVDYEGSYAHLTRVSDVVVVGQRGIGTSRPNTACDPIPNAGDMVGASREEQEAAIIAAATTCRKHWESQGYDLSGFNVLEAAADVDDIRRLMGYETIQLTGGSFGSHWSMAVIRNYPDRVARALLTGMEGPDHTYDMPGGVLAGLERMAEEAERSPELAEAIPEGGLIAAFESVIADVEAEPLEVEVEDPRTGEMRTVRLEADDLRDMAKGYTSSTSSRRSAPAWAADLLALYYGDFTRAALSVLDGNGGLPTASFFMLDCGSGISAKRHEILIDDPAARVVGNLGWWYDTACSAWDADLGEDFRAGFVTDVPVVIVQGTWDTSTPFDNAIELLPSFRDHHFIVVEGGSHGALGEAYRHSPEFGEAMMHFMTTGDRSKLPDTVDLPDLDWAPPHEPL